ncbi:MAG: hypothetical protein ACRDPG_10150, partial [Nocardioidaceae bacterium]
RESRPVWGTLTSYRDGRQRPVRFDGRHDVTASVAMDSVCAAVGGTLSTQHDMLLGLGVRATRPPLTLASSDPARYLNRLSLAGEAAELTAAGGLGDHLWVVSSTEPLGTGDHRLARRETP